MNPAEISVGAETYTKVPLGNVVAFRNPQVKHFVDIEGPGVALGTLILA